MIRKHPIVVFTFCCVLLITVGRVQAVQNDREYLVGVIPQFEQRKMFRIWSPILEDLGKRTGLSFRLKIRTKIPNFEQDFLAGIYDFAYANPYQVVNNEQGYVPLVRDGGRTLKGVLVVQKDSPVQNIQDLNGKILAFPSPNALGASLLIRADLKNLFNIRFTPHYVKSHSSTYLHVVLGLTDAGGGVASTLASQKDEVKNLLRVLYQSRQLSPHPFTAHPRVSEAVQEKVRQALLEMAETKEGRKRLSRIPMHTVIPAALDHYKEVKNWGLEAFWVE